MLTCKQVSSALAREDYDQIHPLKRFFLKLHVLVCPFCGKFNRQLIESQKMCKEFKVHEDEIAVERPRMDEDRKLALKELIAEQSQQESQKAS